MQGKKDMLREENQGHWVIHCLATSRGSVYHGNNYYGSSETTGWLHNTTDIQTQLEDINTHIRALLSCNCHLSQTNIL